MALRPRVTVAGVAVVWGTIGLVVREVDLPAVVVAWCRVAIGASGLGLWVLVRGRTRAVSGARGGPIPVPRRGMMLVSGALLAVHWVAMFAALQRAHIGTVLLIVYLAPVGVAVAAPRALDERVGARVAAALGLAVVGAAMVLGAGIGTSRGAGLALAGLASVTFAAMVLVDKSLLDGGSGSSTAHAVGLRDGVDPALLLALTKQSTAALVLAPFALSAAWGPPQTGWWWLVVLGLVHTAGGLALFLWALARLSATEACVLAYLEPAAAVVFGAAFLGEQAGPVVIAGGLLIVAAGVIVVRAGADRPTSPAEAAGVPG